MELSAKQTLQLLWLSTLTEAESFANRLQTLLNSKQHQPFKDGEEAALRAKYNRPSTSEQEKEKIKQEITNRYWHLAFKKANSYAQKASMSNKKIPVEDLFQQGLMGLWEAMEKFNFSRGHAFGTYALPYVVRNILNSLYKNNDVDIPRDEVIAHAKLVKAAKAKRPTEDDPNPDYVTPKYTSTKLSTADYDEDEAKKGTSFNVSDPNTDPETLAKAQHNAEYIERLLSRLPVRNPKTKAKYQDIVKDLYGLDGRPELEPKEVAAKHGVTGNYVRDIKNWVIDQLSQTADRRHVSWE